MSEVSTLRVSVLKSGSEQESIRRECCALVCHINSLELYDVLSNPGDCYFHYSFIYLSKDIDLLLSYMYIFIYNSNVV